MSIITPEMQTKVKEALTTLYTGAYIKGFNVGVTSNDQEIYDQGFDNGKKEILKNSKYIPKTATGTGVVVLDDVSELPHDVTVKLTSYEDITSNFSASEVGKYLIVFSDEYMKTEAYKKVMRSSRADIEEDNLPDIYYNIRAVFSAASIFDVRKGLCVEKGGDEYSIRHQTDEKIEFEIKKIGLSIQPSLRWKDAEGIKVYQKKECHDFTGTKVVISDGNTDSFAYTGQDGTITVESKSPYMSISVENVDIVDIESKYHQSYGVKMAHEKFLSNFYNKGKLKSMAYALAGFGWTDDIYAPPDEIKVSNANCLFMYSNLKSTKVPIVLTNRSYNSNGVQIGTQASNMFAHSKLREIFLKIGNDGLQALPSAFVGCSDLVDINFDDDSVIGNPIDFKDCKKLSFKSIENVMEHLSDSTTGLTACFHRDAINVAFEDEFCANNGSESEVWLEFLEEKPNWTISLLPEIT